MGKCQKAALLLSEEELAELKKISNSMSCPHREVQRAKILCAYYKRESILSICKRVGLSHTAVYKCLDKALGMGWKAGLKDLPHSPKKPSITMEAKAWLISIACQKPKELGKAAEVWSQQSLANYAREHAEQAGHPSLNKAAKATVARILNSHHLKPHKVKYYLEKRDPDFEEKMYDVLMIYKEVALQETAANVYTVCVDEKPGVQAIENTTEDLLLGVLLHPLFRINTQK